jgi:hypothetical protein
MTSYEDGSDVELDSLEGVIKTIGISSGVVETDTSDDHDVIGHVLLLDYDEGVNPVELRREVEDLPGVVALFESSTGSFHAWCLSIADLDDQLLRGLQTSTDPQHVQSSAKRGYYVLRVGPKLRAERGDVYKRAPELIDVYCSQSDLEQSWAHWQVIRDRIEESEDVEVDPDSIEQLVGDSWRGDRVIQSQYLTMSDRLKEEVRS